MIFKTIVHVLVLHYRYKTVNKKLGSIITVVYSFNPSQIQCFWKTWGKLFVFETYLYNDTTFFALWRLKKCHIMSDVSHFEYACHICTAKAV